MTDIIFPDRLKLYIYGLQLQLPTLSFLHVMNTL